MNLARWIATLVSAVLAASIARAESPQDPHRLLFKFNNREQLLGYAVKVAALGKQFADETSGKDLAAVQPLPGVEK